MTDSSQHRIALKRLAEKASDGQDAFEEKSSEFELSLNFDIDDLLENDLPKYDPMNASEAGTATASVDKSSVSSSELPKVRKALELNLDDSKLPQVKPLSPPFETTPNKGTLPKLDDDAHHLPIPKPIENSSSPKLDSDVHHLPIAKPTEKFAHELPDQQPKVNTVIAPHYKLTPDENLEAVRPRVPSPSFPPPLLKTPSTPPGRSRTPTTAIGKDDFAGDHGQDNDALTPSQNIKHKPTINFGSDCLIPSEAEAYASPMTHKTTEPKTCIASHKIDLADAQMTPPILVHKDGRVSDGLFVENPEINGDSGLPLDDDPLSILSPSSKSSSPHKAPEPSKAPPVNAALFGEDFLGLFPGDSVKTASKPDDARAFPSQPGVETDLPVVKDGPDFLGLFAPEKPVPQTSASAQHNLDKTPPLIPTKAPQAVSPQAVAAPPPQAKAAKASDEEVEMVFEMASLQTSDAPSPVLELSKNTPVKQRVSRHKKRSSRLAILSVIAILGAASLITYKYYEQIETPTSNVDAIIATALPALDWTSISSDSRQAYKAFYDLSRERLLDSELSQDERAEIQGKILIALSLAHTRYDNDFKAIQAVVDTSIKSIASSCENPWCQLGLWAWAGLHKRSDEQAALASKLSTAPEYASLKALIEATQIYAQWQPDIQTREEVKATALTIQNLLKNDAQPYPLGTLILARSHFRLGEYAKAKEIIAPLIESDAAPYLPAMSLDAQISYQLGDFEDAQKKAQNLIAREGLEAQELTEALLIDANTRANASNWSESFDYLTALATQYPQDEALNEQITQICYSYHKSTECLQAYQNLLEANAESAVYRRAVCRSINAVAGVNKSIISNVRLDENNGKLLLKCIEDGLVKNPEDKTLWILQVVAYYAMHQLDEAVDTSLEFERIPELAHIAELTKTIAQLSSSDPNKVIEAKRSFDKYAETVYSLNRGLTLASVFMQWQDFEGAQSILDWLHVLAPQDLRVIKLQFSLNIAKRDLDNAKATSKILKKRSALGLDDQFEIIKLTEALGDANEALVAMSSLVAQAPENPEYLETIALLYYEKGRYDAAKQYFDNSLALDGSNHKAHYYKGLCYYQEKDYQRALSEFQAAISFDIDNPSYNFWLAQSQRMLGENDEAYRVFSRIIDTDYIASADIQKRIAPRELAQVYYYRALLSQDSKRKREAGKDFKQAINLDDKNPQYHQSYAVFLYEGGKCTEALKHLAEVEAISGAAADAVVYFIKAQCALKSRDRALAIKSFEIAIEKGFAEHAEIGIDGYRDPAQIYEQIGYLYRDAGRKAEARRALEQYLEKSKQISKSDKHEIARELDKL